MKKTFFRRKQNRCNVAKQSDTSSETPWTLITREIEQETWEELVFCCASKRLRQVSTLSNTLSLTVKFSQATTAHHTPRDTCLFELPNSREQKPKSCVLCGENILIHTSKEAGFVTQVVSSPHEKTPLRGLFEPQRSIEFSSESLCGTGLLCVWRPGRRQKETSGITFFKPRHFFWK